MGIFSEGAEGAEGALDFIKQVNDFIGQTGAYAGSKSLVDASRHARVEPLMVVDNAALNLDGVNETAQVLQSLFSGYYLMAAEMIANIGGVKVRERLAPLNPNRRADLDLLSWRMGAESYGTMLPTRANMSRRRMALEAASTVEAASTDPLSYLKDQRDVLMQYQATTPEEQKLKDSMIANIDSYLSSQSSKKPAKADKSVDKIEELRDKLEKIKKDLKIKEGVNSMTISKSQAGEYANDITSLSVGKMFDVKIIHEDREATVKVGIRVMARMMPTQDLITMCAHKGTLDHDLIERYHSWRSGRIGFWKDLVLCQDLIQAHRNAAIRDKSGVYSEILSRNNSAVGAGLLERNPSMAVMSTLCIMSQETLDQIERKLGGPITNMRVRNTLFDTTKMMILAVIDPGYATVTFYTHGIDSSSEIPIRSLKNKKGGDDSNVMDIMKAFMSGRSPTL